MTLEFTEVLLRLGAATGVALALGINRDMRNKPIGMRTLALVSLGAAAVALATIQVDGLADHPDALSRVVQGLIQGVMAGIGFLGAGVILRNEARQEVRGLTTAATVWFAAGLGIACGLGAWRTVGVALALGLLLLVALRWVEGLVQRDEG